jgi:hypothetical protein
MVTNSRRASVSIVAGSVKEGKTILEGPATTQTQEGTANSIGTGSIETPATQIFKKKTKTNKNGLVHRNGLHLIKEPLETNGLKERPAGAAEEQPLRED